MLSQTKNKYYFCIILQFIGDFILTVAHFYLIPVLYILVFVSVDTFPVILWLYSVYRVSLWCYRLQISQTKYISLHISELLMVSDIMKRKFQKNIAKTMAQMSINNSSRLPTSSRLYLRGRERLCQSRRITKSEKESIYFFFGWYILDW